MLTAVGRHSNKQRHDGVPKHTLPLHTGQWLPPSDDRNKVSPTIKAPAGHQQHAMSYSAETSQSWAGVAHTTHAMAAVMITQAACWA